MRLILAILILASLFYPIKIHGPDSAPPELISSHREAAKLGIEYRVRENISRRVASGFERRPRSSRETRTI